MGMYFCSTKNNNLIAAVIVTVLFLLSSGTGAAESQLGDGDGSVGDFLNENESPSGSTGETDPAGEAEPAGIQNGSGDQSLFGLLFQMFLALGVVLALIYGMLRFINRRTRTLKGSRTIQSVGGVNVGQNRSVQIVKAGDRLLIVGVGEDVRLLREVSNPDEIEQMLKDHETSDALDVPVARAGEWLKQSFAAKKGSSSFPDVLERRLKGVRDDQKKKHSSVQVNRHD
ncbi:flagellar biosynthetic protein FliO [Alteribacter natronophilus]|uniref:flagellar biosynthetic protein FliO n=1 Tax=Alteribacter natronophilus TaxID=2583810 RepID=UPI00110F194D|nr:flagellar biosynthetic protein FliO [Alteribacter natronophilus]TMW73224.1 hypothetical protein FGB90_02630 [Alteribacter natronophilus]